jgi:Tfp pilus assembly protein PilV
VTRRRDDAGATLMFVMIVVTVLAVASLGVAKLGFSTTKAVAAQDEDQRYTNALDIAAAAGLDSIRAAGNACPTGWPLTLSNVDGLATATNPAITVRLDCALSQDQRQMVLSATRVVQCGQGLADAARLALTLSLSGVGESTVPTLQTQQRNVTDLAGCRPT